MRKGFLGAGAAWVLSATLAWAQTMLPAPAVPAPPPPDAGVDLHPYVEGTGPAPNWMHAYGPGCHPCEPNEIKYYGGHIWLNAEYLFWWLKGDNTPPLVTGGSASSAGILGNPGTTILFDGSHLANNEFHGIRVSAGYTCPDEILGIEGTGFYFFDHQHQFQATAGAAGSQVLARPIINSLTGQETVQVIAFPGTFSGDVQVSSLTRFWGSEVNLIGVAYGGCQANFDMLAGFRYVDLNENLRVVKTSTIQGTGRSALNGALVIPPASNVVSDQFDTRNQFYGGQLGGQVEFRCCKVFIDLISKAAVGNSHETITIAGSTSVTQAGVGTTTVPGGLLALPSNIGRFQHDAIAVVSETQVNVGYQICKPMRVYAGYNFLYWSDVVRVGDQITRVVNESQVPTSVNFVPGGVGGAAPPPLLRQTSFWAHGLNFGLALRY